MATKTKARCNQCDQVEERCECEKYCLFCQGQLNVRLCEDGLYYCDACREAAGYQVSG
jgi:hypothetical protein